MRKHALWLVLAAVGVCAVPRNAEAMEVVDEGKLLTLVGFSGLDVGLLAADVTAAVQQAWRSRGYGGFEATVGAAQVALCLDQALAGPPGTRTAPAWVIGAGLGTILFTHGVVTLVVDRNRTEAPPATGPVTVAPLALSDVGHASVPGLAVLGRF
jgi:hypothetical protein